MQNADEPKRDDISEVEERRVTALLCADAEATVGSGYEHAIAAAAARRRDYSYGPTAPATYADDVADDVQQRMHDEFIDTSWPSCPRHPKIPMGSHQGDWCCDGDPIAPLGALSILRTHEETRRYCSLPRDVQLRVLATFGHALTIAAREAWDEQAPEAHDMRRLLDINETLHRVLAHIDALANRRRARYPDTVIIATVLEYGNERLRAQALSALRGALDRYAL
jgi:hypothetical protein